MIPNKFQAIDNVNRVTPLVKMKTDIFKTISNIQKKSSVDANKLMPLLDLLQSCENRICMLNKGSENINWNSCIILNEKFANSEVDVTIKIAYLLHYINIETASMGAIRKTIELDCRKDKADKEYIRSKEKRNLLILSLTQLFNDRENFIKSIGLNKEEILQIVNNAPQNYGTESLTAIIKKNCKCNKEIEDLEKSSACLCNSFGKSTRHNKISGVLQIQINKVIQLMSSEDIDQSNFTKQENCIPTAKERRHKIVLWIDNLTRLTSDWYLNEVCLSKRVDLYKSREMHIEIWEQHNKDVRLVAVSTLALDSLIDLTERNEKDLTVFLEPRGLMSCTFGLKKYEKVVGSQTKPGKTNNKIKRGNLLMAKMKRCRLMRPDEADIDVNLWMHWYKYSIDRLIVPNKPEPIYDTVCSDLHESFDDDEPPAKKDSNGIIIRFFKWILIKIPGLNRRKVEITSPNGDVFKTPTQSKRCNSRLVGNYTLNKLNDSQFLIPNHTPTYHQNKNRTVCHFMPNQSRNSQQFANQYLPSQDNSLMSLKPQTHQPDANFMLSPIIGVNVRATLQPNFVTSTPSRAIASQFMPHHISLNDCDNSLQICETVEESMEMEPQPPDELSRLTIQDLDEEDQSWLTEAAVQQSQHEAPKEQSIYYIKEISSQQHSSTYISDEEEEEEEHVGIGIEEDEYDENNLSVSNSPEPVLESGVKISNFICPDETKEETKSENVSMQDDECVLNESHGDSYFSQSINRDMEQEERVEEEMEREEDLFSFTNEVTPPNNDVNDTEVVQPKTTMKIDYNQLDLLTVLGMGHFGKVLLVRHREVQELVTSLTENPVVFAIKAINKRRITCGMEFDSFISEKQILNIVGRSDNPFIVEFLGCFQTETHLLYAMEFASGGDLMGHIHTRSFTESDARFYGACIVLAFQYLHKNNIMYRDLKLDNVLMDKCGYVKLTDFGLSKQGMRWNDRTSTFCGTPEFLAPEIINEYDYTRAVDWWAFGVFMFELIRGESPFPGDTDQEIIEAIHVGNYSEKNFSSEALGLIKRLMKRDPIKRLGYGASGTELIKRQPFFRRIDWTALSERRVEPPFVPALSSAVDCRYFESDFTDLQVHLEHNEDPEEDSENSIINQAQFADFDISLDLDKLIQLTV